MKIIITGGRGMVGSNILKSKLFANHELFAPTRDQLDLLNFDDVKTYISDIQPDFIIHAAGRVGGIQANIADPISFLVDNLLIGKNIVIAAKEVGVKRLLNLASSCMYPRNAENPLKEDYILQGELEPTNEGYALAKITITRLCEYITRTTDLEYKTVIPCNLYGSYDKFSPQYSHMIPAVIRKIHKATIEDQKTIEIWGDGSARREFMYVEDLVDFIFYAIDKFGVMPQNINVGLGKDYSINEYYQTIASIIGFKGQFEYDLTKPIGMQQKLIDSGLLREFGWKSKTSLEEGIQKTYNYYLKYNIK